MSLNIATRKLLNDKTKIPYLGLGVYASDKCTMACLEAFKQGYRHIDCAILYGNEEDVGAAVKKTDVSRDDLWLTSKVWHTHHTREKTKKAVDDSLRRFGVDYIDLYLVHNPSSGPKGRIASYLGLQDAQAAGKVTSIGVSNFTPNHIKQLMEHPEVKVKPSVNQIECHLWNQHKEIRAYCKEQGIAIQAYSPLTQGKKLGDPTLAKLAKKHNKTPAQVVLRWLLQQDIIIIPKSENPDRIKENAGIYDFELDAEDLKTIDGMDQGMKGNIGYWDPYAYE